MNQSVALLRDLLDEVARVMGEPAERLSETQRFQDDLGFDSVMLIELKCGLEERYPVLKEASLPDVFHGVPTIGALRDRLVLLCGQPAV